MRPIRPPVSTSCFSPTFIYILRSLTFSLPHSILLSPLVCLYVFPAPTHSGNVNIHFEPASTHSSHVNWYEESTFRRTEICGLAVSKTYESTSRPGLSKQKTHFRTFKSIAMQLRSGRDRRTASASPMLPLFDGPSTNLRLFAKH